MWRATCLIAEVNHYLLSFDGVEQKVVFCSTPSCRFFLPRSLYVVLSPLEVYRRGLSTQLCPCCGSACRSQALLIYCSIVMDYVPQCFVCDSFIVLHSQRKQQKDLLAALQKVVVPIYCTSFLAVEEEKQQKITRVNTDTYFPSLTH